MKALIFLFFLIVFNPCFSQLKKAQKLFEKTKYEKSLQALSKEKNTIKNKKAIALLKFKCNYQLYFQSKNVAFFDKSIAVFVQLYKADKTLVGEDLTLGLHNEIKILAQNYHLKPDHKRAKVYVAYLANYFKDTIDFYFNYYPKSIKSETDNSVKEANNKEEIKKKISRESIIDSSENYLGIKYKWGGEDTSGFDCSGFVLFIMRKFGYNFNHGAKDQSELGVVVEKENIRPGDLVFFGKQYDTGKCKIDHVAFLYSYNNDQVQVIHCTSKGTIIQELKEGDYWYKKILFYKNIID